MMVIDSDHISVVFGTRDDRRDGMILLFQNHPVSLYHGHLVFTETSESWDVYCLNTMLLCFYAEELSPNIESILKKLYIHSRMIPPTSPLVSGILMVIAINHTVACTICH